MAASATPGWVCSVSHFGLDLVPLAVALVALRQAAWRWSRVLAMGLGAGGIAIGIVYNVIRSDKISQRDSLCPDNLCDNDQQQRQVESLTNEAKTASTISMVGFISGGVFLAGGLALVLTAPHGGGSVSRVTATPVLARDFQGVTVTGRLW